MNSNSHPRYGKLPLSPAQTEQLQLDWQTVEPPAAVPRFLDFPRLVVPAPAPVSRAKRHEKRPLAA